ncbi:MAG: hypothetical protein ACTHL1_09870 [Burkholderiaceae bacterium]
MVDRSGRVVGKPCRPLPRQPADKTDSDAKNRAARRKRWTGKQACSPHAPVGGNTRLAPRPAADSFKAKRVPSVDTGMPERRAVDDSGGRDAARCKTYSRG